MKKYSIDPDEIFLDARNLPSFDTDRFEGRLEKPIPRARVIGLGIVCALVGIIFMVRLSELQIIQHDEYVAASVNNRLSHTLIFSERGLITDRNGIVVADNGTKESDAFQYRIYGDVSGMSHIVGYVNYPKKDSGGFYYQTETIGKQGIEAFYDESLGGKNGIAITEKNALGKIISESTTRQPQDGESIVLSIDVAVQNKLYELMSMLSERYGFTGGAGVLLDISNGEVLAATSFPEYDSGVLTEGNDAPRIQSFVNDERKPFLNRAVGGLYTPGSIVKPFVAIAALAEGVISPEKKIESTGSISLPHPYLEDKFSVFKDWKAHGWVNMREAIAVSSNVYFYEVGGGFENQAGIGIEKLASYFKLFGFGTPTGIDLENEQRGVIPTPQWKQLNFDGEPWRVGDTYHTAIGQYGFQVTPIQIARAIAALTTDGILLTPHIKQGAEPEKKRIAVIPENAYAVVREGMRKAVTEGTVSGLDIPAVAVAAKTGTAELGTDKRFVNSWVTGFFPYENPRYSFAIVMERGPRDNLIGATFVMRQLLEWMALHTPEYLLSS